MKYIKHYKKIITKIITMDYRYSRTDLLFSYLKLITKSIAYHKLRSKKIQPSIKHETMLGFHIHFFSYPQLINLFEEIFIYQVYEFTSAKESPLIFDCGSNIGMAILYFKKLYPSSHIIAFEPDHETFKLLQENIKINSLSHITLLNFALHHTAGEMILYKKYSKPGSLNMSLIKTEDKPFEEKILVKKLSDYVNTETDLIKVDVEGAEIGVIMDLIQHQKISLVKNMIIEYHPAITKVPTQEFLTTLRENNILCYDVEDNLHVGASERMVYCYN